jgi:hypothetical protein
MCEDDEALEENDGVPNCRLMSRRLGTISTADIPGRVRVSCWVFRGVGHRDLRSWFGGELVFLLVGGFARRQRQVAGLNLPSFFQLPLSSSVEKAGF